MITATQASSRLDLKRVATYFKQSHKTHRLYVGRASADAFYIADGNLMVKVSQHPDLAPFTSFPQEWERATFEEKNIEAQPSGPDCHRLWLQMLAEIEVQSETLTLSNFLYEVPGARNKPGILYRKFATYKYQIKIEDRVVYVEKRHIDMLSLDIDEVKGFLFEQARQGKPIRIADVSGYIGFVMPGVNIDRK